MAGGLVVILIILIAVLFAKRESVVKCGTKSAMQMLKSEVATSKLEGVDTVRFDALLDSFIVRVDRDTLNLEKHQAFLPVLQKITADKKVDAAEVTELTAAVVTYYPDLEPISVGIVEKKQEAAPVAPDTLKSADTSGVKEKR